MRGNRALHTRIPWTDHMKSKKPTTRRNYEKVFPLICCFSCLGLWIWWYFVVFLVLWFDDVRCLTGKSSSSHLDLAQQNRRTRDVTLLNCFENVLTNEIVWDSGLDKVEETHYMKKLHKGFSSNSLFFLSRSLDLMIFHCFSCSLIWWCSLSRREIKSWNSSSSHLI